MSKKSKVSSAKKSIKKPAKAVKKAAVKKAKVVAKKKAPAKPVKKIAKKVAAKKTLKKTIVAKKAAPKKAIKKLVKKPLSKKAVKPLAVKKPSAKANILKKDVKSVKTVVKPVKEIKPALAKKNFVLEKPAPKKETEKPVEKPKAADADKSDSSKVLAITNTIPKNEIPEISPLKIASITSSITNPIKKNDSYSVKVEKEPQGKLELEFVVRSSPEMLFEFLSTPSGLSEWFCDDVNIRNGIFTFIWDGQLQQARLLKTIDDQLVRFQWVDKTDGSYFEFKIQKDDLTNDISLIVTDFAENSSERESARLLWQSQVEKLMHIIGSIF